MSHVDSKKCRVDYSYSHVTRLYVYFKKRPSAGPCLPIECKGRGPHCCPRCVYTGSQTLCNFPMTLLNSNVNVASCQIPFNSSRILYSRYFVELRKCRHSDSKTDAESVFILA